MEWSNAGYCRRAGSAGHVDNQLARDYGEEAHQPFTSEKIELIMTRAEKFQISTTGTASCGKYRSASTWPGETPPRIMSKFWERAGVRNKYSASLTIVAF